MHPGNSPILYIQKWLFKSRRLVLQLQPWVRVRCGPLKPSLHKGGAFQIGHVGPGDGLQAHPHTIPPALRQLNSQAPSCIRLHTFHHEQTAAWCKSVVISHCARPEYEPPVFGVYSVDCAKYLKNIISSSHYSCLQGCHHYLYLVSLREASDFLKRTHLANDWPQIQ